jgi:hypothetical protein
MFRKLMGGGGLDVDALAFITASGLTDQTQISAINTLVADLKINGLWTKMNAIYPFVGGTATTHKFNLKDPRDLDAAFRIAWSGSVTHNSGGIKSNGSATTYGNTKFNPVAQSSSPSSFSMGIYKTGIEANGTTRFYIGCRVGVSETLIGWITSGSREKAILGGVLSDITPTAIITQQQGSIIAKTNGSRIADYILNGVKQTNSVAQTSVLGNSEIHILRANASDVQSLPTLNTILSFAFIGAGISDTEATNMHNSIQTYQTTLGRAVI